MGWNLEIQIDSLELQCERTWTTIEWICFQGMEFRVGESANEVVDNCSNIIVETEFMRHGICPACGCSRRVQEQRRGEWLGIRSYRGVEKVIGGFYEVFCDYCKVHSSRKRVCKIQHGHQAK